LQADGCPRFQRQTPERKIASMRARSVLLEELGGEEGCRRLSAAFYCLEAVVSLLGLGVDPDLQGRDRTPLYCVANECASETGPEVVRALVRAGADVNAGSGVTRATALHMAARRGHVEIARALLDSGAAVNARDRKADTPLQRAINWRKSAVWRLLLEHGAR
jgi:ankyrin repeat protein